MNSILVIEDGDEYEKFAELFLGAYVEVRAAHSMDEAARLLEEGPSDAFLVDLRFDRALDDQLVGGIEETARRVFSGDMASALRYLKEHQGTFILKELRALGYHQRAVFVHEFPEPVLDNLRSLYGDVVAIPSFDAKAIKLALGI